MDHLQPIPMGDPLGSPHSVAVLQFFRKPDSLPNSGLKKNAVKTNRNGKKRSRNALKTKVDEDKKPNDDR